MERIMIKRYLLLYVLVFTIPLFLYVLVWQSNRYQNLSRELNRLEQTQAEWVESNKRFISRISEYSSPDRIEDLARTELNLQKIRPENFLQVRITRGNEHGN
jgi:cell division protein FtsL